METETTKVIPISLYPEEIKYLKENRINRSKFFRQAIKAHQENKFKYDHLE